MAISNAGSLKLDADFSEDIVGFALDTYFSVIAFPHQRFTIEPFTRSQERWLGADARLRDEVAGFMPFYMQFKRPAAYPHRSRSSIIRQRKSFNPPLRTDPHALFFELRAKKPNHADFQHNILYRWRRRLATYGGSDAVYVCPLFLERSAYRFHLHHAALLRWPYPFVLLGRVAIHDGNDVISFDDVPVLSEHVCIPPHKIVTSSNHHYSFAEDGTGVCFHSPERIEQDGVRLTEWLTVMRRSAADNLITPEAAAERLSRLLAQTNNDAAMPHPPNLFHTNDGILTWLEWGDYLRSQFGIEQFAFVRWRDH